MVLSGGLFPVFLSSVLPEWGLGWDRRESSYGGLSYSHPTTSPPSPCVSHLVESPVAFLLLSSFSILPSLLGFSLRVMAFVVLVVGWCCFLSLVFCAPAVRVRRSGFVCFAFLGVSLLAGVEGDRLFPSGRPWYAARRKWLW